MVEHARPTTAPASPAILATVTGLSSEARLAIERDLYEKLLELRAESDPRGLVQSILELLVAATGAQRGYLALYPSREDLEPRWTISLGCSPDEERQIRTTTSRGIVAATLAQGETLHVPYALLDARFADQASVRSQRLEAVLCVPLGNAGGGVLYLEGKRGSGPFGERDMQLAAAVAKHLWPSLEQVARAARGPDVDPTAPFRERLKLDEIVGRSAAVARVFEQIEPFARLDITMLVTGPNGTGKTQLARAIHANSPRRAGPFVELNCSAIPEGLIESELFGTMPGAFPGARRNAGKVEAAEGGTLFLDEIVEIPLSAQGKLLQLLQSRQFHPLGSARVATANVRVIVATNVELRAMVDAKRFREDLYWRINVVQIRLPALAERAGDIPVLVDQLLVRVARDHSLPALPASEQFRRAMEAQEWPGNIRQLRSAVEAALIKASADGAPQVELRHAVGEPLPDVPTTFHGATRAFQRELLRRELVAHNWHVQSVAKRLDLTKAHVYNLIHQFELR
jgi:Nif-specific regulatory protein